MVYFNLHNNDLFCAFLHTHSSTWKRGIIKHDWEKNNLQFVKTWTTWIWEQKATTQATPGDIGMDKNYWRLLLRKLSWLRPCMWLSLLPPGMVWRAPGCAVHKECSPCRLPLPFMAQVWQKFGHVLATHLLSEGRHICHAHPPLSRQCTVLHSSIYCIYFTYCW